MIARLPNDRRPFMGNRLELVCLLQAAEIERLAAALEEYRLRLVSPHADTRWSNAASSTATPTRCRSRS